MKRFLPLLSIAALLAVFGAAHAKPSQFDGAWNVTLTCPPHNEDDEAKGYTQHFPGEVVEGQMRAVYGVEGEPGWHLLTGPINPDGSATLSLEGIVNSPEHAINHAQRGKAYKYKVKAQFKQSSGSGERLTGRVCQFQFSR